MMIQLFAPVWNNPDLWSSRPTVFDPVDMLRSQPSVRSETRMGIFEDMLLMVKAPLPGPGSPLLKLAGSVMSELTAPVQAVSADR